jgi:hypothetical protein
MVSVAVGGVFNPAKTRVHAWAFKFFRYDIYAALTEKFGSNSKGFSIFCFKSLQLHTVEEPLPLLLE